jgi:hypothetical protein
MSDAKAIKQQIIVAVVVGLAVGSSAPWWWSKIFPPTVGGSTISPTPFATVAPTSRRETPTPPSPSPLPSRTTSKESSSTEHFKIEEDESATTSDGVVKLFVVKVFNNRRGVDLSLDSVDSVNIFEALIDQPISVPGRDKYIVTLRGFDGAAAIIEISQRE